MVWNTMDGTTFMEYVQFLPSRRLYSSKRSINSTSMTIVLPPKVIGKAIKIPYGEKDCPSKVVSIVGDGMMGGVPRAFQQDMDITEVTTPSSTTFWWMSFYINMT